MTEIPEGLQTPPAACAVDQPPPLQPGTDAQSYHEFNLDNLDDAPAPNFIAFGHDPAVPDPAAAAVINAWALEDLSSDDDMFAPTETATQSIKGPTVHDDVHAFSKETTWYIQGGRMSSYDITRLVQAWALRCDDITHGIIQRIMLPHPQGFSLANSGESVVGTAVALLLFLDIALRRAYEPNPHGWR